VIILTIHTDRSREYILSGKPLMKKGSEPDTGILITLAQKIIQLEDRCKEEYEHKIMGSF
jgi:hypothetical protein